MIHMNMYGYCKPIMLLCHADTNVSNLQKDAEETQQKH